MVDRQIVALVTRYGDATDAIRQRVGTYIQSHWAQLGSWRDADLERFLRLALPAATGGQRQIASLTDAYLSTLTRLVIGSPAPGTLDLDAVTGRALRGVNPTEVYARPFQTVWSQLADGAPLDRAVTIGAQRLDAITSTDLQLARTHTARDVFSRDGRVVGYRRTLGGRGNCPLCVVASTQRYHAEDLMPIHDRCSCGVEPIYGDEDPGQIIDPDLHAQLKSEGVIDDISTQRAARSAERASDRARERADAARTELRTETDAARRGRLEQRAADWDAKADAYAERSAMWEQRRSEIVARQSPVAVHEHGELGPVLTNADHAFRGPHDL